MEARKITVVSTQTQGKSVITTNAETLAEFKKDLDAANINYDGMTFFEGISRTELKDNTSILPRDVPYKGTTTNELVFMLTNTNKKIKSGAMSRVEVYAAIKKAGLQEIVKATTGKNFTQCSTESLIDILAANKPKTSKKVAPKRTLVKETKAVNSKCIDAGARGAISCLIHELYNDNIINENIIETIDEILQWDKNGKESLACFNKKEVSTYSDSDIDDMFSFLNE